MMSQAATFVAESATTRENCPPVVVLQSKTSTCLCWSQLDSTSVANQRSFYIKNSKHKIVKFKFG